MKSKIIPKINARNLTDALESIGWKLLPRGCGHYQIFNDYNKPTQFWFYQSVSGGQTKELTLGECKEAFGRDGKNYGKNGSARFPVDALTMRIDPANGGYPAVSLLFRGFTKGNAQTYISFYGVKMSERTKQKKEQA